MTTANKITLARIALIPFFIWFATRWTPTGNAIALVLFLCGIGYRFFRWLCRASI